MEKLKQVSSEVINNISTTEVKSGITFNYNNERRVLSNNYHTLVIGEDDLQKEEKIISPLIKQISKTGESFIINDKSGNLYNKLNNLLQDSGYKVVCLNMDNPINSDGFNILELSYNLYKEGNIDKALEVLENIGHYMFCEEQNTNVDPFWVNSAINFFVGCTLYMFENEKEISLNKILELSDKLRAEDIKEGTTIYTYLSGILMAPADTKGSILAVFKQKFNKYVSREKLSNLLSNSSFDIKNIIDGRLAIFIIEGTCDAASNIVPLIINQVYFVCNIYGNNKKINVILDNFDNMIPIKNIETVLSLCSSLNINITSFIKNFTSLNNVYGKETGDNLKIYFKNIIYLYSNDATTLEYVARVCGTLEYMGELRNIKDNEALFILIRNNPFIVNI